jgi:tetratricopeptide (TPR) repeat protein
LQVSAEQLDELLGAHAENLNEPASLPNAEPRQSDDTSKHETAELQHFDIPVGIFFPVIVNSRPVLVPPCGDNNAADWHAMSPSNRRLVLGYGFAATAAAMLGLDDATSVRRHADAPLTLAAATHPSWARATHDAVLNPMDAVRRATASADDGLHDLHSLRAVVDQTMRVSLSSDYGALEQSLPALIGCAEAAYQALSDVYAVAGWTLIKADNPAAAWIAAQRAIQAAEQVGDVLRTAAATRCLAEVHMRADNLKEATRIAFLAAVQQESASPDDRPTATSLRGAALLSAAAASARRGDGREAHAALKAAAVCAAELGQEHSDLATVFGPTNVAIHQVAIAIELGDAPDAIRHIPAVQLDRMPPLLTERRARFLIDVARSYARLRDDAAAIDALLHAETIAPDELHHHRLTHELVPQLLTRENRTSDLRALATRCNLLN